LSASKCIPTRRAAQWLEQHTAELEFTRLAELLDADNHAVMAGGWLITIGTEQAILPWQIKAQITVGLANQYRMVDAMHVGLTTIQRRQKSSPTGTRTLTPARRSCWVA
jgi:hypothetical protein